MINIFSILQFHPWKDVLQNDEPNDQNTVKRAFQTLKRLFGCKHQGLDIFVSYFPTLNFISVNMENIQMQKLKKAPVILLSFKELPEERNLGVI